MRSTTTKSANPTPANRSRRIRRQLMGERGNVLVLTALFMLALVGMAAYVIDVGDWYHAKRRAQTIADAAALAGAQLLGTGGTTSSGCTTATTCAETYVSPNNVSGASYEGSCASNGSVPTAPTSGTPWVYCVTTPYNSNSNQIQVTVSGYNSSFFAGALGVTSTIVSSSAVAGRSLSGGVSTPETIFAGDTSCSGDGIKVNGQNNTVTGGVHSNGKITINNSGQNWGSTSYGGPNSCSPAPSCSGCTFSSGPTLQTTNVPYPADYRTVTIPCANGGSVVNGVLTGVTSGNSNVTSPSALGPAGTYCFSGNMSIGGSNITWSGYTFIAGGSINFSGSNETFTPAYKSLSSDSYGLTAMSTATSGQCITLSGASDLMDTIFAPACTISLNPGQGSTNSGFVESYDVDINGSGFNFTGTGPSLTTGYGYGATLQQ